MYSRFICPHCHSSFDPLTLEVAASAEAQYRICTECDSPVVLSVDAEETEEPEVPLVPRIQFGDRVCI